MNAVGHILSRSVKVSRSYPRNAGSIIHWYVLNAG